VTARPAKRLLTHGWLYVPAASSPVGGGLIKLGHGSTWAAVTVGAAPYVICAFLYTVFVIGYLAALTRCLFGKSGDQAAMERLITVSANAVVAILTLTAIKIPPQPARAPRGNSDSTPQDAGADIAVQNGTGATRVPLDGAQG
jgi:hypothetical protein